MNTIKKDEPEIVPILGIETSGEVCGVAVYFDEKKFAEISLNIKNIHSEKILEIISKILDLCNISLNDIASIAVSAGPGSFTGLRIGMSVAKGLAFGADKPIIPVPTFDALAYQIVNTSPVEKNFAICSKVNNEEIYIGKYSGQEKIYKIIEDIKVAEKVNLIKEMNGIDLMYGNIKIDDEPGKIKVEIVHPDPVWICRWAYHYNKINKFGKDLLTFDYDFLEPNYLKNFIVR